MIIQLTAEDLTAYYNQYIWVLGKVNYDTLIDNSLDFKALYNSWPTAICIVLMLSTAQVGRGFGITPVVMHIQNLRDQGIPFTFYKKNKIIPKQHAIVIIFQFSCLLTVDNLHLRLLTLLMSNTQAYTATFTVWH